MNNSDLFKKGLRKCQSYCKKVLSIKEFDKDSSRCNRLSSKCKSCTKQYADANRDKLNSYQRKYKRKQLNEQNKETIN